MFRRISVLMLAALAMGCGSKTSGDNGGNALDATGLDPTSSNVTYAKDWTDLQIDANFAHTSMDNAGHFTSSRNACGKRADGVISLADWNQIAGALNTAVSKPPLASEQCVDITQDFNTFKMDGTAAVTLANGTKRQILEVKGSQTIGDPQAATALVTLVNQIVVAADKQDCPNGWGSG
jgi:hypothetical protein